MRADGHVVDAVTGPDVRVGCPERAYGRATPLPFRWKLSAHVRWRAAVRVLRRRAARKEWAHQRTKSRLLLVTWLVQPLSINH